MTIVNKNKQIELRRAQAATAGIVKPIFMSLIMATLTIIFLPVLIFCAVLAIILDFAAEINRVQMEKKPTNKFLLGLAGFIRWCDSFVTVPAKNYRRMMEWLSRKWRGD